MEEEVKVNKKEKKNKDKELIETLTLKVKELEDKNLRVTSEMINSNRRKDEECNRLLKYKDEDIIMDLLQVVDNFERAIKLDDTNLDDELSKFLEGFKMIYCNILNVLKKYGVIEIDGFNKPFNPTYHQAVLTEKVEGVESGYVVEVLQKGYILKDKVIRPAMVKVNK